VLGVEAGLGDFVGAVFDVEGGAADEFDVDDESDTDVEG